MVLALQMCKLVDGKDFTKLPIFKLFSIFRVNHRYKTNAFALEFALFLILLFIFRIKSNNFNRSRLVVLQAAANAVCLAGCLLCWMMVRTWVEWIPSLARPHRLLRGRGQLAAMPRAGHFRTFPVEMHLAVCTKPKCQAG